MLQVDWATAAAQYDPDVKVASFKTVTLRAMKKCQAGAGITPGTSNGASNGEDDSEVKPAQGKGGRKRKTTADTDANAEGDEEDGKKAAPKKKGWGGKKAKAETEVGVEEAGEAEAGAEGKRYFLLST